MATYNTWNLTGFTNVSGKNAFVTLISESSKQVNYMIGTGILVAIWFTFFFALKLRGATTVDAGLGTSFMCTLIAILMYALGALHPTMLILFIVLTPLFVLIKFLNP